MLEYAVNNNMKRANREMKRYACTGNHSDVTHPTTLKREYRPNKKANRQQEEEAAAIERGRRKMGASAFCSDSYHSACIDNDEKNHERRSLTTSPTKKKPRRRKNSVDFSMIVNSGGRVESDGDEESTSGDSGALRQQLFLQCSNLNDNSPAYSSRSHAALSQCVTPAGGGAAADNVILESAKKNGDDYTSVLEEKNVRLNERVIELARNNFDLVVKIEALSAEIERLKIVQSSNDIRKGGDGIDESRGLRHGQENKEEENLSEMPKRHRIQAENAKLASELSVLINDFVTSSRFADGRKFPTSRLGRIIFESILSFEWTHSEISKLSPYYSSSCDGDAYSTLSALLNVNLKRCRNKCKAAILVDCLWNDDFLDGEAQRYMIERVRCYLRKHVFTPWKIVKAMDLAGFNLSLAGLEVLRRVDVTGRYARGIIPSKSTILRSARMVEAAGERYCPFSMIGQTFQQNPENADVLNGCDSRGDANDDNFGEGFEFDAIKVTETLFDAFGLMNVAKTRPVELALTSDGAQLTNNLSHVAAGLKFNDMAMRDPLTKSPLLLHAPDSLVQSRNLCFPLRIVIARDNKATLNGFRPLYNQFRTGEVAQALQCHSFKMSFPGDMKLQWGALDNGGAAKVKEKFCYICPCLSSTLHVPRDKSTCHICMSRADEENDEMCYHYPFMADPEVRGRLAEELHLLSALVQDAIDAEDDADGNEHSPKMHVRRPGEVMIAGDLLDIDFHPSDANEKAMWARHITRELANRSLPVTGTLVDCQQRLRSHLVNELRCRDVTRMLADSEPKDQAMYLVLQAVVCILHLENRVGLKSIESILRSGLSNARKGTLDCIVATSINRRQEEYVERITTIICTEILGTVTAPSQWRFPLTEEGIMGTLSMDNNRTRSVIDAIELLIVESFPATDTNKELLLRCFPRYRAAVVILRKNTDATVEEIATFQVHIDAWFRDWIKVYGKEGCTNYTHMLSSSHVMRYMQEWKCLHRFSQQGREALNALI